MNNLRCENTAACRQRWRGVSSCQLPLAAVKNLAPLRRWRAGLGFQSAQPQTSFTSGETNECSRSTLSSLMSLVVLELSSWTHAFGTFVHVGYHRSRWRPVNKRQNIRRFSWVNLQGANWDKASSVSETQTCLAVERQFIELGDGLSATWSFSIFKHNFRVLTNRTNSKDYQLGLFSSNPDVLVADAMPGSVRRRRGKIATQKH